MCIIVFFLKFFQLSLISDNIGFYSCFKNIFKNMIVTSILKRTHDPGHNEPDIIAVCEEIK